MKALLLKEYMELELADMPQPDIGAGDVLVRVRACGICGSDVHGLDGSTGRRIPPLVMGHEAAGVIERVGKDVQGWQEGDRVTFDSTVSCGQCHFCRRGEINLCDNRQVLGVSCGEYRRHGANMSGDAGDMLRSAMTVRLRQRRIVTGNAAAERSWKEGIAIVRSDFGERLRRQVWQDLRRPLRWPRAALGLARLVRYYPGGLWRGFAV